LPGRILGRTFFSHYEHFATILIAFAGPVPLLEDDLKADPASQASPIAVNKF
jgi:hypothetical protein